MQKTYEYIQDSGHGWLKVKKSELARLNISSKISSCSYQNGEYAYLEEDLDAGIFIEKKQELNEVVIPKSRHVNRSRIRNYQSFTGVLS